MYVAGSGRSGTTALALYLESEIEAFHAGELRYVWQRGVVENQLCECGLPFRDCEFWSEVLEIAYGPLLPQALKSIQELSPAVDRMRHIVLGAVAPTTGRRATRIHYSGTLIPLYAAIAKVSKAATIIDSSKDPSYLFALSRTRALDLTAVHFVRDSRAVAYSWSKKVIRPEIHWKQQHMDQFSPRKSASLWMTCNTTLDMYRARHSSSVLLKYEAFAANPQRVLGELAHHESLASGFASTQACTKGHSFSGNPMRFNKGPLEITLDEQWRTLMPPRSRRQVSLITMPMLLRYGYRLRA